MGNYTNLLSAINNAVYYSTSAEYVEEKESTVDSFIQENNSIEEFLQTKKGSQEELNYKHQFVKDLVIASKKGELSIPLPQTPLEIATLVDEATNRIKAAYEVDIEKVYPEEAVNDLIDRGAAKLSAIADKAVDQYYDQGVNIALAYITKAYPPAKAIEPYVKYFAAKAKPMVKSTINQGINKIASWSKGAVKNATIKVGKKVQAKLRSIFHK